MVQLFFSVEAPEKLPIQQIKKKVGEVNISPYCWQAPSHRIL